ncbi:unnamed protein product [Pseudo-nitzschia multistriata]|uniref:Uncharacterized protein n=1 Tax=Pseudo-nitzschia multistriata TaxID=183589 RepID=A0A448ZB86_9STRA|nr:unnamed protein product [Pseudo-nitzschia multistriata]
MNFSKIAVTALSFNYSPWFVQGEEIKHKVGPWELHPIGNDVEGTRFGTVRADTDAVTIKLHVEGSFDDQPTIEVFSGVADGEACATGTMITTEGIDTLFSTVSESPLNELRVTSDGAIGLVIIGMSLHNDSFWTAINEDNTDVGTFNACVRVTKKHDGNYVSFVDTSIKVNINAEGKFQTFENAITVVGTSMKSLEQNQTKEIVMDSYLCGPSDSGNPERSYKIGQSFSICVGPTEAEKNNYDYVAVVGFEDVTCAKTIKVVEDGDKTALTTVTTNPEGYKKAGEGTVGTGFSSFETVVTPEYYTGVIAPNEASVTCSGTVELSFTDPNPPAPKFTQVGCQNYVLYDRINYDMEADGAESDVQACNDHCHTRGYPYFILICPFTNENGEKKIDCACHSFFLPHLDCDTRGVEKTGQCDPSLVSSDYKFGVGPPVTIDDTYQAIQSPVYQVVPNSPSTKYEKAGCIDHGFPYNPTDKATFPLTNAGSESDATKCNDHCANLNKQYFVLDCPNGSDDERIYTCSCADATTSSLTDGICPGESPTEGYSKSGSFEPNCKADYISNSEYGFGFLRIHPTKYNIMASPAYQVVAPGERRLTASFSTNSGDLLQRHLQESGNQEDTRGSFGTEVLLSREDNAVFGNLAAPAADTGAVPSTAMASAAGALVVAAAAALA